MHGFPSTRHPSISHIPANTAVRCRGRLASALQSQRRESRLFKPRQHSSLPSTILCSRPGGGSDSSHAPPPPGPPRTTTTARGSWVALCSLSRSCNATALDVPSPVVLVETAFPARPPSIRRRAARHCRRRTVRRHGLPAGCSPQRPPGAVGTLLASRREPAARIERQKQKATASTAAHPTRRGGPPERAPSQLSPGERQSSSRTGRTTDGRTADQTGREECVENGRSGSVCMHREVSLAMPQLGLLFPFFSFFPPVSFSAPRPLGSHPIARGRRK